MPLHIQKGSHENGYALPWSRPLEKRGRARFFGRTGWAVLVYQDFKQAGQIEGRQDFRALSRF
jgi:hypothetical protein